MRYYILVFSVCSVSQKLLKLISKLCPLDCNRQEEKEEKQTIEMYIITNELRISPN